MSSCVHRSSHLSRHLAALRQQRDLKPGQLAARLGASNLSKVGSLIRAFELGEPISDHWLQKLIAELQPDPAELRRCLELDQAESLEQLERERDAWEAWAEEPIDPYLSIRYSPGAGLVHKVPRAFCTPRETTEDREWARQLAEDWAADRLKRCPHKGILTWSRRERTWFDEHGLNPRRGSVTFEGRTTGAWMQLSGSQQRFLLGSGRELITRSHGLDQP
ncbi:hypothetical protein KBY70_14295 [Cyanobium sp. ATX 6E8]|uniref:hypothetical protein n=1 Tax=Cyanobium sp. ATX 6E8 TaxID=2823701 RepID=UPI0020CEEDB2|nr:hypothetical protein [Cyanobium sp. ATX 6E8]MCP9943546.1 hypothetical protein [Cyanobium sp. ATX 6E8]